MGGQNSWFHVILTMFFNLFEPFEFPQPPVGVTIFNPPIFSWFSTAILSEECQRIDGGQPDSPDSCPRQEGRAFRPDAGDSPPPLIQLMQDETTLIAGLFQEITAPTS